MNPAHTQYTHLFGPVPSRRLGRSLGVDIVPFKVCSLNCIYCQLGATTSLTTERQPYVAAADVIEELRRWIENGGSADYITLSGSGEPTLNSELDQIIEFVQQHTDTPMALLTNGTLFGDPQVRAQVSSLDLLIPSLDAATDSAFQRVNRPAEDLDAEGLIEGIAAAREQCAGQTWLEVMLVQGVNDSDEELMAIRRAIERIQPHRVQINTVVRPPAEPDARALSPAELAHARDVLGPLTEIVAPLPEDYSGDLDHQQTAEAVHDLLRRRPCTINDIALGLSMHPNEATKYVQALLAEDLVEPLQKAASVYYKAV